MTTLTKASDIAEYLTGLLAQIKVADGYHTDIGLNVYRGRRKIDDDLVPCAVIIEGDDRPGDNTGREEIRIDQSYVFAGYVTCDADNPNDEAHLVIKDLKRVIFGNGNKTNLGGRVRSVSYEGRDIGPRSDGKAIVMAVIYVDVTFAETLADA
jgi:hypothetical protein